MSSRPSKRLQTSIEKSALRPPWRVNFQGFFPERGQRDPKATQREPKGPQGDPKGAKESPRTPQDAHKAAQRGAIAPLGTPFGGPWAPFGIIFGFPFGSLGPPGAPFGIILGSGGPKTIYTNSRSTAQAAVMLIASQSWENLGLGQLTG